MTTTSEEEVGNRIPPTLTNPTTPHHTPHTTPHPQNVMLIVVAANQVQGKDLSNVLDVFESHSTHSALDYWAYRKGAAYWDRLVHRQ